MAFIPEDKIKEILSKINIVDVIREYIPVERAGRNFKALCPFHDDSNPSLSISQDKQIFKCFVCGTGGNAITFVQKYKGISFFEASKILAEKAGVDMAEFEKDVETIPNHIKDLHKLLTTIEDYAMYTLYSTDGMAPLKYLKDRGLKDNTIYKFKIGYIPSTEKLLNFLEKKGFKLDDIKSAGIINEEKWCFMKERISFPIKDINGHTVGFSCRAMNSQHTAKYMNSMESEVFKKERLLFNLSNARSSIKQHKEVILMEGQIDIIKADQNGISNCVSSLGTALTDENIKILKNLKVSIKLCYDGDNAGRKATLKSYHALKSAGVATHIVHLPEGMDPDETMNNDPDNFRSLIAKNENILDYILQIPTELTTFEVKEKYTMGFLKELYGINDVLAEDHYINLLSQKTGFSIDALAKKYSCLKPQKLDHIQVRKNSRTQFTDWRKSKNIKINFKIKGRENFKFKNEVQSNYDRLSDTNQVIAFDQDSILERNEVLKKYVDLKGTIFETTVTMINYDNAEYLAQSVTQTVANEIAKTLDIPRTNLEYVAYLHKDTKHPHIHMQLYQKETYLENYKLTSKLVENIQKSIAEELQNMEKALTVPEPVIPISI